MQIDLTPSGYDVRYLGGRTPFVTLEVKDTGATLDLYLESVEAVDDLIAAALEARSRLTQHAPRVVA